jgi:DNA-binding transcriptional MocR family regulator
MGIARRQAIVAICGRAGAHAFASTALPPLAALAPDITLHVNGLSKSLGPGLRIGVLALPAGMMDAAEGIVLDRPMEPSPLSCAVVEEWLASGVIASVQKDLGHETRRRSRLASSLLGMSGLVIHPAACQVWLPAPRGIAGRLVLAATAVGIKVTQPESVMAEREDRITGIRLCLGGPTFEELTEALSVFAELLKSARSTAVEHQ